MEDNSSQTLRVFMEDNSSQTLRVFILCTTIVILGLFMLLFKTDACKSSPAPKVEETCREEFVEIRKDNQYNQDHKCTLGATIETINSPPAPKAGIFCRCPKTSNFPAPTTSASSAP